MAEKIKKPWNLHGLRVLVTRPAPAGEALCEQIDFCEGMALHFPTIAFAPPSDVAQFQLQIMQLDHQDWVIFISPQAAYAASAAIQNSWSVFPWQVRVAAVGEGTAKALQKIKVPVHVFPSENWGSEGLLNLPEFQQIKGRRIALIKGEGGRKELAEMLLARGALLSEVIAYRRCLPQINVNDYVNLIKAHQIDVVVCTSGEGVFNLKELLKTAWSTLQFVPLVVISPRMVEWAKALGFKKIILAKNAGQSAIMETLGHVPE